MHLVKNEPVGIQGKIAINISGVIEEVDGDKVKLDNGQWVVITEETLFEDDPDNGVEAVSRELLVGNFIQGYTNDNPENDTVDCLCYQQ